MNLKAQPQTNCTRLLVRPNGEIRRFTPTLSVRQDDLHRLLSKVPDVVAPELMWLAQQIPTANGRKLDLLAIDRGGTLFVIEARHTSTAPAAFADAIVHQHWCKALNLQSLIDLYEEASGGQLAVDFYNTFGEPIALNGRATLCVVAPDASRIGNALSALDAAGLPAFGVKFDCFEDGGERFFAFEKIH